MITILRITTVFLLLALFFSCAVADREPESSSDQAVNGELYREMAKIMEYYNMAVNRSYTGSQEEFSRDFGAVLQDFDNKYNSNLYNDYRERLSEYTITRSGSDESAAYPVLTDLPVSVDGAVYVSGGKYDMTSAAIDTISPFATNAHYFHAGALDLDKHDPTNLEAMSIQSGGGKGAYYESVYAWSRTANVAVLNPKLQFSQAQLDQAQAYMDHYCKPENTGMSYGFFQNTVNFFNPVTKEDNYYWYCTKVVWRIYQQLGYDIDSNTDKIDWSNSSLYTMSKAYFYARYFYSPSTAESEMNKLMQHLKTTLILAEEVYFSPDFTLVYEAIRDPF